MYPGSGRDGHVSGPATSSATKYSSKAIGTWLRRRSIPHTIQEKADQAGNRARRGSRGGRPPAALGLALLTASSYAEPATKYPQAGGASH